MLRSKLNILILLLATALLPLAGHAPAAAASYSQADQDAINKLCAQKTGISQKSKKQEDQKVLGACEEGYILGMEHPKDSSPCNDSYKGDKKALNACENVGFPLGKSNPLKIKPTGSGGGGSKGGDPCSGSACSPTPIGNGHNCDQNQCDLITLYVNPIIRVMTILVGLAVAASLVMGGIQYTASSGDPQKVGAAKSRISNTLLAFFAYAFLYAFLNFIIPGGVFR